MASEHSGKNVLFRHLRRGRQGTQLRKMLRVLSFVLHGWCTFKEERILLSGEKDSGELMAIPFCKLANFVTRIWTTCYQLTCPPKVKDVIETLTTAELDGMVTFPSPFTEIRGKHGRTPACYDGKKPPHYINKVVFVLQSYGLGNLFEIQTPKGKTDDPNDYRTTYKHGTPIPDPDHFLGMLTEEEKAVAKVLSHTLRRLGPRQIRALGTHENYRKTLEDVAKEFEYLKPYLSPIVEQLPTGIYSLDDARKMEEFADEACRKSFENRVFYTKALETLKDEIKDLNGTLEIALADCQQSADEIWERDEMRELARLSTKTRGYAKYLRALAYYQLNPSKRGEIPGSPKKRASKYNRIWYDGLAELKEVNVTGLPRVLNNVFESKDDRIRLSMRTRLITDMRSLNREIEEGIEDARREISLSKDSSGS